LVLGQTGKTGVNTIAPTPEKRAGKCVESLIRSDASFDFVEI